MRVVWTRRASRHLRAAYDYWAAESSPTAADTMLERIFTAVEMLERFPEVGRRGRISGPRELPREPLHFP
jgi:toxin ParE1/3/4